MATATAKKKKKSQGFIERVDALKNEFNRKVNKLKKEYRQSKTDKAKGAEVGRKGALRDYPNIPKRKSARAKATQNYKKTMNECAKHEELGNKLSR